MKRDTHNILDPLMDRFGRVHTYLRISVIERCNLRCLYCMPAEGIELKPREHLLRLEEIERIARLFSTMGITKVRLTGGEPLIRRNLEWLIDRIAGIEGIQTIAMTTNAILLGGKAAILRRAGLQQLNISLDTLKPERFRQMTLRDEFDRTMEGVESALAEGFHPLKINAVIMGGINDDEILDMVEYVRNKPVNMRFIEYMPFKGNGWKRGKLVSFAEMRRRILERYDLVPIEPESSSDVAKDFRIEGFEGTVSFITSMTEDFCSGCNRIRLLADGSIKSCLFHKPEENLRDALRRGADDSKLEQLIRSSIAQKLEKHEPMGELESVVDRSMIEIGG
jgi:cyclic pyranopterin phosphate synthase